MIESIPCIHENVTFNHCQILKLLTTNDTLNQTWILDVGASLHMTPTTKDCFVAFRARDYGKVYLGNNQACWNMHFEHLVLNDGIELVLYDVKHVLAWESVYYLFLRWICMDIAPILRLTHRNRQKYHTAVKGTRNALCIACTKGLIRENLLLSERWFLTWIFGITG